MTDDVQANKSMPLLHRVHCEEAVRYFDMTNTLFLVLDKQGRIQQCNRFVSELLDQPQSKLIASNWFEHFVPSAHRQDVEALFQRLLRGEGDVPEHYENPVVTASGEERCIRWSSARLYAGQAQVVGVLALGEDVTDRKRQEHDLNRLAAYRELILRLSSDFIRVALDQLPGVIDRALADIGQFMQADRAYIFDYDLKRNQANNVYEWCAPHIEPEMHRLQGVSLDDMPEWLNAHLRGDPIVIPRVASMAKGALKTALQSQGIQSLVAVPIMLDATCHGFVGIDLVVHQSDFDGREPELVALFAQLLSSVLARQKLEEKQQLSDRVFEASPYAIVITDAAFSILSANPAFEQMTGYALDEVTGLSMGQLSAGIETEAFDQTFLQQLADTGAWEGEIDNRRRNGEIYPQWLSVRCINDVEGQPRHYVAMGYDLTESKAQKRLIDQLSHYDSLTGLPNLSLLKDRVTSEVYAYPRQQAPFALVHLDLDNFATVNDAYGLPVGDRVIEWAADRIRGYLRDQDTLSRETGDEFFVLLPQTQAEGALNVVGKLLKTLSKPLTLEKELQLNLTATAGIALFPEDGADYDALVKAAGIALHRAKQTGKNGYAMYTWEQHQQVQAFMRIENELHEALSEDQLVLYFQPQYAADSRKLVGAEALIRWAHPKLGLMPPGHFIPVAEKSQLILDIGRWVIQSAIEHLALWQTAGHDDLTLAINLSASEFQRTDLPTLLSDQLTQAGLPARALEVELTETVAMENSQRTLAVVQSLHALGIKLALDDFGTGYSSLTYLRQFEVDKLKIDQSFVSQIGQHLQAETIVDAVIQMAKSFGYQTLAEGVENKAQYDYLLQQGCDQIQGFYLSRPLSAQAFMQQLDETANGL